MKTDVTLTSIEAFHANAAIRPTQAQQIAEYCEAETRKGRLVWIGKIARHFYEVGKEALSQKSTVSARFNEIKEHGVMLGKHRYKLELIKEDIPPGGKTPVEMYWLVIDAPASQGQQALLF